MQIGEFFVGPVSIDWQQAEFIGLPNTTLADANVRDDTVRALVLDSLVVACTVGFPMVVFNPSIPLLTRSLEAFTLLQPGLWWTAGQIWQDHSQEIKLFLGGE